MLFIKYCRRHRRCGDCHHLVIVIIIIIIIIIVVVVVSITKLILYY